MHKNKKTKAVISDTMGHRQLTPPGTVSSVDINHVRVRGLPLCTVSAHGNSFVVSCTCVSSCVHVFAAELRLVVVFSGAALFLVVPRSTASCDDATVQRHRVCSSTTY